MKTQPFESLLATDTPPSLVSDPRPDREPLASLERKLDEICQSTKMDAAPEKLIRSLLLLWHDHLDESHTISQDIHSADGSFLHGIMHRREPDYWNSKYWFSRVGHHPSFPEIGRRANALLQKANAVALQNTLLMDGDWNPIGFIDAVEQAVKSRDQKRIELLQSLQEIETRVLLEGFCAS